jgi:SAM-dependent methyltransferase
MDAAEWDARYAEAPALEWGSEPNRWVVRELADLPPGRALDLAAGEGRNAVWLARRGWTVTAVDFSQVGLDKGRALAEQASSSGPLAVQWVTADVVTYEPTRAGYDLVLLAYLHLPAAGRRVVLRRAAEALSSDGVLLVVGHDTTNLTEGVGGPQDASVLFTAQDVLDDLADSLASGEMVVERAEAVRRTVETPTGSREAVDALARLSRR